MAKQKITIKDVAEELDLSKATVSYVLSGKARMAGVSETTARQVKEVAQKLGYVPNHWARTLRNQKTGVISVLFMDLIMGWAQRVMEGIESVLLARNYTPAIFAHTRSDASDFYVKSEAKKFLSILERRDEGVICQPLPQVRGQYLRLLESGVVMVFISTIEDMQGLEDVDSVTWDCGPAARMAVQHLIRTGFKRIGYIGLDMEIASCRERFEAYLETMDEAGLEVRNDWVIRESMVPSVTAFTNNTFSRFKELMLGRGPKPEAFYVMDDYLAIRLIEAMHTVGLRTPDDVALIGMGELDTTPIAGLSTMREPLEEIGAAAAEQVLARIENPGMAPVHRKISCNELITRQSTTG